MTDAGKKWAMRVMGTVTASVLLLALVAQLGHYARAGDTDARSVRNEEALVPLIAIAEALGARASNEDAKVVRDGELCRAGMLSNCSLCGSAGVKLDACVK
jgi:hypothetical protein